MCNSDRHPRRPLGPFTTRRAARWTGALCGLWLLTGATVARAQTSAPDAASLQATLRAWIAGLLAPALILPEPELTVAADGDGFLMSLPVPMPGTATETVAVRLRPLPGTRWAVDEVRVPTKGAITLDPAPLALPDAVYTLGDVSARAVIDPTLTSRSTLHLEFRDGELAMRVDKETQKQRFDRYVISGALIPGADGRLDITQEATITEWESGVEMAPGQTAETTIRRGRITGRIEGLRVDRAGTLFTAVKALVAEIRSGGLPDKDAKMLPPTIREHARALVESLRDIAVRLEGEETLDDFSMTIPGIGGFSLDTLRLGGGGEAPDGRLRAWADIAMEGLDIEGLPKEMRDYVPSRVALRPVFSGVSTEKLFSLMLRVLEENPDEDALAAEARTILTTGGASIGLESMTVDLDPLHIEGSGRLRMLTPDKPGVEGRVTATGFDAAMADASRKPDLRAMMPVLAMIRGFGRQEGDRLVWDLALTEDQAFVNGIDVLATPAPADPPPRQRPNRR